jgi:hypothetical protein
MGVIRVIDLKRGDRRENVYDECENTVGCMIMYKRSMPVMRTGTTFVFYFNMHAAFVILMCHVAFALTFVRLPRQST